MQELANLTGAFPSMTDVQTVFDFALENVSQCFRKAEWTKIFEYLYYTSMCDCSINFLWGCDWEEQIPVSIKTSCLRHSWSTPALVSRCAIEVNSGSVRTQHDVICEVFSIFFFAIIEAFMFVLSFSSSSSHDPYAAAYKNICFGSTRVYFECNVSEECLCDRFWPHGFRHRSGDPTQCYGVTMISGVEMQKILNLGCSPSLVDGEVGGSNRHYTE